MSLTLKDMAGFGGPKSETIPPLVSGNREAMKGE